MKVIKFHRDWQETDYIETDLEWIHEEYSYNVETGIIHMKATVANYTHRVREDTRFTINDHWQGIIQELLANGKAVNPYDKNSFYILD